MSNFYKFEVDQVIDRMQSGEPLRWVLKSSVGRHRPGTFDTSEPWIGSDKVMDHVGVELIADPRIQEIEHEDMHEFIDYELVQF